MQQDENVFGHERLEVYQLALELLEHAHQVAISLFVASTRGSGSGVAIGLPRGRGDLSDQLRRAASSITLNIAEGAEESSKQEKRRFYRMGRRSAAECTAILDVGAKYQLVDEKKRQSARSCLLRIVLILVKLGAT